MHSNDTAIGKLIGELLTVSERYMMVGHGNSVQITAWVSNDHDSVDVVRRDVPGVGPVSYIDSDFMPFSVALDDVLGKIALAAPQQVSA